MQSSQPVLNGSKGVVSRGDKLRFWQDVWCGTKNFQSCFPLIFAIAKDKTMLVENAYGVSLPLVWDVLVIRNLND